MEGVALSWRLSRGCCAGGEVGARVDFFGKFRKFLGKCAAIWVRNRDRGENGAVHTARL